MDFKTKHPLAEVLHLMICPAVLSAVTGACYAYRFQAQYTKSILAAGVLFFEPRRWTSSCDAEETKKNFWNILKPKDI